jgi:hypothetical protein
MINDEGKIKGFPRCPNPECQKPLDGFTALEEGAKPREGDISICAYCAEVCEFDFEHHPVTMPLLTYNSLPADVKATIDKAQQAIVWNMEKKH